MKIKSLRQVNVGGGSNNFMLAPLTLFTGTNRVGKSTILRGTELALTAELTDPENPTDSIKLNARLFKLATDGHNEMSSSVGLDDGRTVERRYVKTFDSAERPSITYLPSLTGQPSETIGKAKETDAEIKVFLRPDYAGINIMYLAGLTEMKRREQLINMIADAPRGLQVDAETMRTALLERFTSNGDGDDLRITKLLRKSGLNPDEIEVLADDLLSHTYHALILCDKIYNHVTQNNTFDATTMMTNINEMLAFIEDLILDIVHDCGGYGNVLDRLREVERYTKELNKALGKELKNTEGSIKKLTEDGCIDVDPADLEDLENELKKLNKEIPGLTEQRGNAEANMKAKASLQNRLDKLPSETVSCPGKWTADEEFQGWEGCTGDDTCPQCKGTGTADIDYYKKIIADDLPEAQDKAIALCGVQYQKQIEDTRSNSDEFIRDHTEKLEAADATDDVEKTKVAYIHVTEEYESRIKKLNAEIQKIEEMLNKIKLGRATRVGGKNQKVTYLELISGGDEGTGTCPLCRSKIDLTELRKKLLDEIGAAEKEIDSSYKKMTDCEHELADIKEQIEDAQSQLGQAISNRDAEIKATEDKVEKLKRGLQKEIDDTRLRCDSEVKQLEIYRDTELKNIPIQYAAFKKQLDLDLLTIENASSITDVRIGIESEMDGLEITDVEKLATRITQMIARQTELNTLIAKHIEAGKVSEQLARFNEEAEIARRRLMIIKMIIASTGTKGLQGEIFKSEAQPFINMVNEIMEPVTPGKEFVIDFYDPRGKEACVFGFRESVPGTTVTTVRSWTWETASRGERNMAAIAIAIARMRLNTQSTLRALFIDNLDMMDSVYEANLDLVLKMCLGALEQGWIDNVLAAGIIDPSTDIGSEILDDPQFKVIELSERKKAGATA